MEHQHRHPHRPDAVHIGGNTAPTNPDNHNDGGVFTIDGTPVADPVTPPG